MTEVPEWFAALGDRYRFEREIGRGGMAHVYLAEELRHARPVAIKILSEELARVVGPDRFLREVDVAAQLNHPNILPLLDSGTIPASSGQPERPYFVMPYVAGESLKDRLARGPLELPEALTIVRAVAGALDHAHGHRIIHRDIKPANILLSGGTAVVADFGIARALDRSATEESLTGTGLVIGTPHYMAPEQAGAGMPVDGRADVYALGCVVYEMLSGAPPFPAPNMLEVIAQHRLNTPPTLGAVRPALPLGVVVAVDTALAKDPDARFSSAGTFAEALEDAIHGTGSGAVPARATQAAHRRQWRGVGIAAAIVMAGAAVMMTRRSGGPAATVADSARYAILPFESARPQDSMPLGADALRDAFARWGGVNVADAFQLRDQLARHHLRVARTGDEAVGIALSVGAGRHVRTTVSRAGDSLRVDATLYNSTSRSPLTTFSVTVDSQLRNIESAMESLADSLLLRGRSTPAALGPAPGAGQRYGTRSVPASRAFWEGQQALQEWNLARADTAFAASVTADRAFAQAALWLALVRSWGGQPTASWSALAYQSQAHHEQLSVRDRIVAMALASRARGDLASACHQWSAVTRAFASDFVSWYGLGDCLASDDAVVKDRDSPSGWRFRTSYHSALTAYRQAYLLMPSILLALQDRDFQSVRRLFKTSSYDFRNGYAQDGTQFWARPAWAGDTLALVPWPAQRASSSAHLDPTVSDAIVHQRRLFYQTVAAWVAAYPDSPDALAALAQARELLGDQGAVQSLAEARRLEQNPDDRRRLGTDLVWLQLKRALPDDSIGLEQATALADSLLREHASATETGAYQLAALAAVTGRAALAVQLVRRTGVGLLLDAPPALTQTGPSLELLSAIGASGDTLAQLEDAVRQAIRQQLVPAERPSARMRWLGRPATLAYPAYRSPDITALRGQGDYFLDAIAALESGDTTTALELVEAAARRRATSGVMYVTVDQLPALAALYDRAGRRPKAIQLLDAALLHLFGAGPEALSDPVRAASLGRSIALRADLAAIAGDTMTAARWGRTVSILWRSSDPGLQVTVRRMRGFSEATHDATLRGGPTRRQ